MLGDRWSNLILKSIFLGKQKFDDILLDTAISSNMLADRLSWLIKEDMINQVPYRSNPLRYEYQPTKKGLDYFPVLVMLQQWGDQYCASPEGPPVVLIHKTCGHPLSPIVVCSACEQALPPEELYVELVARGADTGPSPNQN